MKSRRGEDPVRPEVREDRDKARMLLGAKLLVSIGNTIVQGFM